MRFSLRGAFLAAALWGALTFGGVAHAADQVKTANGMVQGATDPATGIHVFKGIPYAQPPVGDLRWREPQPVRNWDGVRPALAFGPRAMQLRPYSDMNFRSNGVSEDCLYLNVWTPATSRKAHLPVLVYFFGGGFIAGDASEPRYDGESMARRGIVSVTVTFRLGLLGFLALPALTQESPHQASGDYGLLDQSAALHWVQTNIAAFGGDPKRVTIAGESAGSFSVCAQMASPLSKNLIAGAIGESGSLLDVKGNNSPIPLAQAEQNGVQFAASMGVTSLAALRALPAEQLLEATDATGKSGPPHFGPDIDGYFLPKSPIAIYATGEQAHVPLLVGWNSQENGANAVLKSDPPTPENLDKALQTLFGDRAADARLAYPAATDAEALQSATALASDRFIAYGTWKWYDLHRRTGGKPVYRYFFSRARPGADGAVHSAEIEYALGNLAGNTVYAWTPDDEKVSVTMQSYFADFIKTGDPNGPGLPLWPAATAGANASLMHLDVNAHAEPDRTQARYQFLDQFMRGADK